jgi:hypothetical protein
MNTIFKKFVYSIFISMRHIIYISRTSRRDIGRSADPLVWIFSLLRFGPSGMGYFAEDQSGQGPCLVYSYCEKGLETGFLPFIINEADSRSIVR